MSIRAAEIATKYGALDATAFADGGQVSAYLLRTLAMTHNRLVSKGGAPLCNLVWPSTDATGEEVTGKLMGIGWPFWHAITPPFSVPKKPGLVWSDLDVIAQISGSDLCTMQAVTRRAPYVPGALTNPINVIDLEGDSDDDFDLFEFSDIVSAYVPISPDGMERLQFFLRGTPTSTTGYTPTYGSPNTGTAQISGDRTFTDATSASWNVTTVGSTNNWADGGHCVVFANAGGELLTHVRSIVSVGAGPYCHVYPPFTAREAGLLDGSTYTIYQLPRYQIANIAMYPEDRTE